MKRVSEELYIAPMRIGVRAQAMKWLLRFLQTNLSELSPGQITDLKHEVAIFALYGEHALILHTPAGFPEMEIVGEPWIPESRTLAKLQKTLMPWFSNVPKGLSAEIPLGRFHFRLRFDPLSESVLFITESEKHEHSFALYALLLLSSFVPQLRKCPECRTIFVADRRSQIFCSIPCLRRVSQRNFQKRRKAKASTLSRAK